MKIKNVENKEKPEYDTKSEKQNKFLKLIFEHKKITIVFLILLILSCTLIAIHIYNQSSPPEISGLTPIPDYTLNNSNIELYNGNIKGTELRLLIKLVNSYNKYDIFPTDINITYLSQPELTITSGDSYLNSWIRNSNYYQVSFEYDDLERYITTVIIKNANN